MPAAKTPTKSQRPALAAIKAERDFEALTLVADGGEGYLLVEWVNDQGESWQTMITPKGNESGRRQIWC